MTCGIFVDADQDCHADRKPIDPPPIVQLKVPEVKDPIRYVDPIHLGNSVS